MTPFARACASLVILAFSLPPSQTEGQPANISRLSSPPSKTSDDERVARENASGSAMAAEHLAGSTLWAGPRLNEYVNRLGQNLVRASEATRVFTFRVVYSPVLNAQSFPNGFVFVNTGVISAAESEAELAAVLAHEIAHINACHWRRGARRSGLFGLLRVVALTAISGPVGLGVIYGSGLVTPVVEARFSRSDEREADRLAIRYLVRAGYDPHAAARMLDRLQARQVQAGIKVGGILSTHPHTSQRRESTERFIGCLPQGGLWLENNSEFGEVREEVRRYDEVYARAVGARPASRENGPPKLSRRPTKWNP